jgi:prepilin-type N-terminal cleavage/methylation domain-containing protein
MPTPSRSDGGFTLVELLVTLGVIAIILSISLPALVRARDVGVETSELSLNRQSGMTIAAYTNDHAGEFPYWGVRGTDLAPLRFHDGPRKGEFVSDEYGWHWHHVRHWAYFVMGEGYDARSAIVAWFGDESTNNAHGLFPPRAWDALSPTTVAAPTYFDAPLGDASLFGGQRIHMVSYPAKKGILRRENWRGLQQLDSGERGGSSDSIPAFVWFADGHSAMHAPSAMAPGVRVDKLYEWQGPVFTTSHGVLGRDL